MEVIVGAEPEVVFNALGSDVRMQILEALFTGPKSHSRLAEILGKPLGVKYHLRVLQKAGVIEKQDYGGQDVAYLLVPVALSGAIATLSRLRGKGA